MPWVSSELFDRLRKDKKPQSIFSSRGKVLQKTSVSALVAAVLDYDGLTCVFFRVYPRCSRCFGYAYHQANMPIQWENNYPNIRGVPFTDYKPPYCANS